jgi:hypothetical protein
MKTTRLARRSLNVGAILVGMVLLAVVAFDSWAVSGCCRNFEKTRFVPALTVELPATNPWHGMR